MGMKAVEANAGRKIPYSVSNTKVTFDDELMLNVAKLERDFDVCVDICIDKFGMVTTGLGVKYAAQIEVPARQYVEREVDNPEYDEEDGNSPETVTVQEPVAFSMDNVTLRLYAID